MDGMYIIMGIEKQNKLFFKICFMNFSGMRTSKWTSMLQIECSDGSGGRQMRGVD